MTRSTLTAGLAALLLLSACTTPALEPIPGSITYGGQPRTKLTKSPIGSTFPHRFRDDRGDGWEETYRIAPDRSLDLISRRRVRVNIRSNS
jgi:hypothetical protein